MIGLIELPADTYQASRPTPQICIHSRRDPTGLRSNSLAQNLEISFSALNQPENQPDRLG